MVRRYKSNHINVSEKHDPLLNNIGGKDHGIVLFKQEGR